MRGLRILYDENIPLAKEALAEFGDVIALPGRSITCDHLEDIDILIIRSVTKVNRSLLAKHRPQYIFTATSGTDHLDIPFLQEQGIHWGYAPGCNARSVAEYVLAAILSLAADDNLTLAGKSIGIVGAGHIGSLVAQFAHAIGLHPVLCDPPLAEIHENILIAGNSFGFHPLEASRECDIITMHVPLTAAGKYPTQNMIDKNFWKNLWKISEKKCWLFVNAARGEVVNAESLIAAKQAGSIKKLVLDVFPEEPQIDPRLCNACDLATPHIAGYSYDGKIRGLQMVCEQLSQVAGLNCRFPFASVLLSSPMAQLSLDSLPDKKNNLQQKIELAVCSAYPVQYDRFRLTGRENRAEIGAMFDSARKNYPVRREFASWQIRSTDQDALKLLKAIGFSCEDSPC